MPAHYTHTFKLIGQDSEVEGRIEFNHDGVISFDFTKSQMTAKQLTKLQELFTTFQSSTSEFGEITKLELEKE